MIVRVRRCLHWLALVLGALALLVSVVSVWARNQVLDTDRYVRTVAPLADDPDIQRLVVDRVTIAVADPRRTAELARGVLPRRARPLATPIAAALERLVRDRVGELVASPELPPLWTRISRRTHESAVALLTGREESRLRIVGDRLVLRLGPLIGPVRGLLERSGVDTSLLRDGPEEPVLVLADAAAIGGARGAVGTLERFAVVWPLLTLLCFAAAIWLGLDRRRAVLRVGLAIALGMVALAVALALARTLYLDAVTSPRLPEAAAAAFYDILLGYLRLGMRVVLAAGLVLALAATLAGPSRPAAALRAAVRGVGIDLGPAGRWVAGHRRPLEWLAAGVGVLVLVGQDQATAATVLTIALALLAVVGLLELIAASARAPTRSSAS